MNEPSPEAGATQSLTSAEYETLAEFRYVLRHFLAFSEAAARDAGLTPQQHQALLAIKGFSGDRHPTVGDLAERLALKHNSVVELINRLMEAGFVSRDHDKADARRVLLSLTDQGERRLATLSISHLEELRRLRQTLKSLLATLS